MISCLAWVPKGVTKPVLAEVQPTEEEIAQLQEAAAAQEQEGDGSGSESGDDVDIEDNSEQAVAHARSIAQSLQGGSGADGVAQALAGLDMDRYDDEDGDSNLLNRILGSSTLPGQVVFANNDDDPYITVKDEDDDESDPDFAIRENDLVLLAARNEDDVSNIEVYVYEPASGSDEPNLYVHHDIMLPAFPLCLAWMDCDPSGGTAPKNMVAIGTLDPGIEVWDLDIVDNVEPAATLGGFDPDQEGSSKKKPKKKRRQKVKPGSHEDSVLGLSWNSEYRNVLASGSADMRVKVWDIARQACEHTLTHHSGKVQAVLWNPVESPILLTGSFDKTACLVDVRAPDGEPARWQVSADVEALCWVPHQPTSFLVSSEDGIVACFDARRGAGSVPLYRLAAHDKATCALSFCPGVTGLLATASTGKEVKLWDVSTDQPSLVAAEDVKVGAAFTATFCKDLPHLLAVGGSMGIVSVWDLRTCPRVVEKFPQLVNRHV